MESCVVKEYDIPGRGCKMEREEDFQLNPKHSQYLRVMKMKRILKVVWKKCPNVEKKNWIDWIFINTIINKCSKLSNGAYGVKAITNQTYHMNYYGDH